MPHNCLWRSESRIRQKLNSALRHAAGTSNEEIQNILREALKIMAESLNATLAEYTFDGRDEADVYFWPGYDSILSIPGKLDRLMLKNPRDGLDGGIGFTNRSSFSPYRDNLSLFAFQEVLQDNDDDSLEGGLRFHPGGTHAWVADAALTLLDEKPLNVIAIEIEEAESQEGGRKLEPDSVDGLFRIHLDLQAFAEWGNRLASILNDPVRLPSLRQPGAGLVFRPLWPYHRGDKAGDLPKDVGNIVQEVRQDLYCIWLAANLDTSPTSHGTVHLDGFDVWVKELITKLNRLGLRNLGGRIAAIGTAGMQSVGHSYRYWYTFNLERTVSPSLDLPSSTNSRDQSAEGSELGSLMILSSHQIPRVFFSLAKPWVERVYGWMRAVESAIHTARVSAQGQSGQFVHQVAGLVDEILDDPAIEQFSPQSWNAAWQLQALIRVWSSKNFQPRQLVTESNEKFWRKYRDVPDAEFLEFLIQQALRHAFRRAMVPSSNPKDPIGPAVRNFVEGCSGPADALTLLHFSMTGTVPHWVKARGFVVAFHHTLWQAAQHALRSAFASLQPPFLWLECSSTEIRIQNRSELGSLEKNPKDWLFFSRLEARMREAFAIESSFDKEKRTVVTRIIERQ